MLLKQKKGYSILLFLLSPILGLVFGLRHLDKKGKHFILIIFGLFYGLLLTYEEGFDAYRYKLLVESYYFLDWSDFIARFWGIITFNPLYGSPNDLYIHLLCSLTGSLLQSSKLLFGFVGAIYGFFYGRALLNVIQFPKKQRVGAILFLLIFLFVIHRSYDTMQTVRSWTGMWVLFNGVFSYHQTKNKKYIFLILLAPLFHLMYFIIIIPALIAIFSNRLPKKVIIALYAISFITNVNSGAVVKMSQDNDLASKKVGAYYRVNDDGDDIDPIQQRRERSKGSWYAQFGKTDSVYLGTTVFICLLIFGGYYLKEMNSLEEGLMTTGVLLATLANFGSFVYAFYSRTMANSATYILAVIVLLAIRGIFRRNKKSFWVRIGVWVGIFVFVPKIVFFLSDFMYKTSMMLIAFPFLSFLGSDFNFSIRDFINVWI